MYYKKEVNNYDKKQKLSNARITALHAISDIRINSGFARDVLNRILDVHVLSSSDRAFASKLVLGVVQTWGTLNEVIYKCVDSPDDIKENVMDALRISAYEILYLEKEAHAAVDQGVELVKLIEPRARGLANLVLRRVVNEKNTFPYGNPDDNIDAFARIYAIPKWLLDVIFNSLGEKAGRYLISSCNGQAPCYIFVNTLKVSVEEVFSLLESVGAKPKIIDYLCGVTLSSCIRIDSPMHLQKNELKEAMYKGQFFICDIASQAIVELCISSLESPKSMLDMCSGRGNKSLMFQILAQKKYGYQFDMFSLDNIGYKNNVLRERAKQFGVNITSILNVDASNKDQFHDILKTEFNGYDPSFDFVFIDAPCSGLGTLRRHPELKWRLTPDKISQLAAGNLEILKNASSYVKSGGSLFYSTCTVTHTENEDVCDKFCNSKEGSQFKIRKYKSELKEYSYFRSQTYTGLNDCHFCAAFKFLK